MYGVDVQDEMKAEVLHKFPLLNVSIKDAELIRRRRCLACIAVTDKMIQMPSQNVEGNVWKFPSPSSRGSTQVYALLIVVLREWTEVSRLHACSKYF